MKFIVSTSALLKQLQLISGVVSNNAVLPILEDFKFDIKGGKMTVFASDLETSMSAELDVDAAQDGSIAIPAKILTETLKTLPEQPLTFSFDEESFAVEITSASGKYKLAGENPLDFPKIPGAEESSELTMDSKVLANAISKTIFATTNDEMRPAMTGVFFELGTDGVTFVSTDAHKLVRYKRSDASAPTATSFIVPKKALNLLKNSLAWDDSEVKIAYNQANAFFQFGNINLICRLIDAKYPDYNAVIPLDNPNELHIDRKDLLNALKRISIYSNKTTNQAKFTIHGKELVISAKDLDFSNEASERLSCHYEGDDMEIAFNAKFLMEMLNAVDTAEVKLELSSPSRAGVLFPAEQEQDEDLLMLVMPVMVNG